MVFVKLLKDVAEGGVEWVKNGRDAAGAPLRLKTTKTKDKIVNFTKDTVITMHEASAAKYVERGLGEVVKQPSIVAVK